MWNKPDSRVLDVNVSLLKRLILFVELFLIRLVARGILPGASPFFIFLLVQWLVLDLDLDLDTSDGLRKGWYDSGKVWSDKVGGIQGRHQGVLQKVCQMDSGKVSINQDDKVDLKMNFKIDFKVFLS